MGKTRLLLAILLLVLGLILCAFSMVVTFAVVQIVRSIGQAWVFPLYGVEETLADIALFAARVLC